MILRLFSITLRFCLLGFLSATATIAAEIELHNVHVEGCTATLNGRVEAGDTERVRAALPGTTYGPYTSDRVRLCLNSQGGNFLEGLELAAYLSETGIETHVAFQDECMSACAIAFLGGTRKSEEEGNILSFVSRSINAEARLGFHAPRLDLREGNFNKDVLENTFDAAIRAVGEIFSRLDELRISRDFALDFLSVPNPDFYLIDSPIRLHQMQGSIEGNVRVPINLSNDQLEALCALEFDFARSLSNSQERSHFSLSTTSGSVRRALIVPYFGEGDKYWDVCELSGGDDFFSPNNTSLSVTSYDQPMYFIDERSETFVPSRLQVERYIQTSQNIGWTALSSTLLTGFESDISSLSLGSPEPDQFNYFEPEFSCAPASSSYAVTNVNDFATLRGEPNYGSEVIAEIPRGDLVSPVSSLFVDVTFSSERCRSACDFEARGALTSTTGEDILICTYENSIWWRVQSQDGQSGWMSRKFLVQ